MQNQIIPHLWFDKEAKEAATFYASIFPNAKVVRETQLHDVPSPTGDSDVIVFTIDGFEFQAINAGPYFKVNPSISFFVNFDPSHDSNAKENLTKLWNELANGGKALMELGEYPFSKLYGWIEDKFGVSWQLILSDAAGEPRPFIMPSLLFTKEHAGHAEEAINFYASVFKDGKVGMIARYPAGMEPDKEGSVMFGECFINGTWLTAMDSARTHQFEFTEGVSLIIPCDTQDEIDYFWEKLSAVPESEQCGWLKDKFGVSWQVWPTEMGKMMEHGTPEQVQRLTKSFLQMKKFNIEELKKAFEGK